MDDVDLVASVKQSHPDHSIEGRLRARMQADALQPVANLEDDAADARYGDGSMLAGGSVNGPLEL